MIRWLRWFWRYWVKREPPPSLEEIVTATLRARSGGLAQNIADTNALLIPEYDPKRCHEWNAQQWDLAWPKGRVRAAVAGGETAIDG